MMKFQDETLTLDNFRTPGTVPTPPNITPFMLVFFMPFSHANGEVTFNEVHDEVEEEIEELNRSINSKNARAAFNKKPVSGW